MISDASADGDGGTPEKAIVHLVDDEAATRTATARLLSAAGFDVRMYTDASDFLNRAGADESGCILLDVRMPGLSGLDLQTVLTHRGDALPIVFLTGHGEIPDSVRAIQHGAVDYLTKPVDPATLLDAVSRALARNAADRRTRARQDELRARYNRLTQREREVLRHLISGQLNKQAAADLGISERTMKIHRARVLQKLETDSMAELARLALALGIEPSPK